MKIRTPLINFSSVFFYFNHLKTMKKLNSIKLMSDKNNYIYNMTGEELKALEGKLWKLS